MGEKEALYPIGVVSRLLGVHPRTLRIYEKEGLVSPERVGGKRYYSEEDLYRLKCIRALLKEGINIAGIKKLFSLAPCWRVVACSLADRVACPWYKAYRRWRLRIAFATESADGLESLISFHFRKAPYFTFVELDEEGEVVDVEVKENPYATVHGFGLVPDFIRREGAETVVTGGMGERAAELLKRWGVEPITGAQGKVLDVLKALLTGEKFEPKFCTPENHRKKCKEEGK